MKSIAHPPQYDEVLKKALGYSLGAHIAVLLVFVVRVVLFPSSEIPLENAIRVDMVALPDRPSAKLPPPPQPAPEPKKVKEESPPPPKNVALPKPVSPPPVPIHPTEKAKPETPKISLKKARDEETSALKRLEAMERLEKMSKAEKPAASAQKTEVKSDTPPAPPVKGNAIAKGSALSGIARLDNDNYIIAVTNQVKQHWNLPRWLSNGNYRAVVKVFVDAGGNVLKKQLIVSSGNETYDERVMDAVETSTPFPAPPADLVNRLSVYGIDLDLTP